MTQSEPRQDIKEIDDDKRILNDSRDEELAAGGFKTKIVRNETNSSAFGAALYKKKVVAVLRRQIAISSSQDVVFSSQEAPKGTWHRAGTLHRHKTKRKVREKLMALRTKTYGGTVKPPGGGDCLQK